EYTYSTFVVVDNSAGSQQLDGEWTPHVGDRLDLSPDDFPVSFISVEATPDLLEIGEIDGVLRRGDPGESSGQTFHLDLAHPAVALPLARGTADATMELVAQSRDGATLRMEPVPASALQVGLHSFQEYGLQKIEIECFFGIRTQSFALELLPEGRPESSSGITLLHFRPDRPKREWTWFAASPFQAGYRYRPHRSADQTPSSWSPVRSPFEPLRVLVADAPGDGS
ncbi:MAG: hypothetical protein M3547_01500, partial [Acidobacteriota bacterium]|nr:hypothetical protein [Acidobacteriota bacterium]